MKTKYWFCILIIVFIVGFLCGNNLKFKTKSIYVQLVRVYDGDTIFVNIDGWPDVIGKKIGVRVRGIDCPEMDDHRENVKIEARKAKDFVSNKITHCKNLELRNIGRDKYFRILADVYIDNKKLSDELLSNKLARPYDGGAK